MCIRDRVLAAVLYGIIFGATDALVGIFNSESSARMAHQCIGSTKDDAVQHRCQHRCV